MGELAFVSWLRQVRELLAVAHYFEALGAIGELGSVSQAVAAVGEATERGEAARGGRVRQVDFPAGAFYVVHHAFRSDAPFERGENLVYAHLRQHVALALGPVLSKILVMV